MMQRQKYAAADMTSSWAGAFGQTQFVPTTFLDQGVDGDGDGRIDLWNSVGDALASTANVLSSAGWKDGKPWAMRSYCRKTSITPTPISTTRHPSRLEEARRQDESGRGLASQRRASFALSSGGRARAAFLVFANFKVILKYNNAASYALAVCLLADQLKGAPGVVAQWPRDEQMLNRDERLALQTALAAIGYNIGKIDGLIAARRAPPARLAGKTRPAADGFATRICSPPRDGGKGAVVRVVPQRVASDICRPAG